MPRTEPAIHRDTDERVYCTRCGCEVVSSAGYPTRAGCNGEPGWELCDECDAWDFVESEQAERCERAVRS